MLFGQLLFLSIECSILYLSLLKTYLSNELDRLTPLCKISWDNLSSQHRDIASSFWALSWNNTYIYVETGLCDQLNVCRMVKWVLVKMSKIGLNNQRAKICSYSNKRIKPLKSASHMRLSWYLWEWFCGIGEVIGLGQGSQVEEVLGVDATRHVDVELQQL